MLISSQCFQELNSVPDAAQHGQQLGFWKAMLAADPVTQKQKDIKVCLLGLQRQLWLCAGAWLQRLQPWLRATGCASSGIAP